MSPERHKGLLSLSLSFALAVGAVGTAVASAFLDAGAVLGVLAIAACIAFAALIAGFVSLRGPRAMGSALAIVAGLLVLGGVGIGFGAVGFSHLIDLAGAPPPIARQPEAVVDEMFRFELLPPNPDAWMYDTVTARAVNDRARAGFWTETHQLTGLVFVEPLYGRTLPDGIQPELDATFTAEPEWQSEPVPVSVGEHPAWRVRRRWIHEAVVWHSESTFFTRDDWLFHLYAVHEDFDSQHLDVWFPQILDNFNLLSDGTIDYTDVPRRALIAEGPGFRVRNDLFEDGLWGLRVDTGGAYELSWWHLSTDIDNGAIVTLVQRRPDLTVSISPHALGGRAAATVIAGLRARLAGLSEAVDLPPIETELAGLTLLWDARTWVAGYRQEARAAWWHDETRVIELVVWSPVRGVVDASLPGIDARVHVDAPRRPIPSERRIVTEHAWVSGGVIRFDAYGVSWRCPSDLWRVIDHRRDEDEGAWRIARIEAPTLGVTGRLVAEHLGYDRGDVQRHDTWLEWLTPEGADGPPIEHDRRVPFSGGGVTGLRSDGIAKDGNLVAISTVDDGGLWSYTLELTASPRDAREHRSAIAAALEGLAHAPVEPRGFDEHGVYADPRFGYAVSGFQVSEVDTEWTELDGGVGSLVHFLHGGGPSALGVMAVPVSPHETPEDHAERLVRRYYAWVDETLGTWERRTATLAGYRAHVRELRDPFGISHTAVYRLVREGVLYVVIAYSVGAVTVDELASRLSLR